MIENKRNHTEILNRKWILHSLFDSSFRSHCTYWCYMLMFAVIYIQRDINLYTNACHFIPVSLLIYRFIRLPFGVLIMAECGFDLTQLFQTFNYSHIICLLASSVRWSISSLPRIRIRIKILFIQIHRHTDTVYNFRTLLHI